MPISLPDFLLSTAEVLCITTPLVITIQMVRDRNPLALLVWVLAAVSCGRLFGAFPTLVALSIVGLASHHIRQDRRKGVIQ